MRDISLEGVQIRLPFFIQEVYNRLGYRPPVEFEELFLNRNPCSTTLTETV